MRTLSPYKRISLWLIPPEPVLSSLTHTQHQLISIQRDLDNHNNRELPTFVPHVTLVGGIPLSECCCSVQEDEDVVMTSSSCVDTSTNNNEWEEKKVEEVDEMDEVAAKSLLKRLTCAFHNFGGVQCSFVKERGVFAARRRVQRRMEEVVTDEILTRSPTSVTSTIISEGDCNKNNIDDEEGEVQWNQSCISIMERSDSFLKAMELVERILFTDRSLHNNNNNTRSRSENELQQSVAKQSMERHFKAPVCEPHYSFVYGNDAELITSLQQPSSLSSSSSRKESFVLHCPPNFTCTEIAVVWTYPSCLEGVKHWREIGRFTLEENKSKY